MVAALDPLHDNSTGIAPLPAMISGHGENPIPFFVAAAVPIVGSSLAFDADHGLAGRALGSLLSNAGSGDEGRATVLAAIDAGGGGGVVFKLLLLKLQDDVYVFDARERACSSV